MSEIQAERVTIDVNGKKMGGYLAVPKGDDKKPVVLVFQEIFGINSHIRDITERVAKEGYIALAPDYYWRVAPGIELGYNEEGFKRGMELLNTLKFEELLTDINAAISLIKKRDDIKSDRIGCMGFCIGGHVAYLAACETEMKVTASFYGGGIAAFSPGGGVPTVGLTPNIDGEILCMFGEKDSMIPQEQVETIKKALKDANITHEVIVYPEADHGFFCDQRSTFHEASRDDAWKRVKSLFQRVLKD